MFRIPGHNLGRPGIHRRPFEGTRDERYGGIIRTRQNWIGGDANSPLNADYVPPPGDGVPRLLADLPNFCSARFTRERSLVRTQPRPYSG
jgi:hypothetical protein